MTKTGWTDIDRQGRGMAQVVEFCKTMRDKEMKKEDPNMDLVLAFIDRQIKSSTHQAQLTQMNLKLNMLFKLAEKKHADEIVKIGLEELSSKKK